MPSANYRVVEPHPSIPHTSRPALHTARGGAGNIISLKNTKTTPSRSATGPPSLTRLDSHTPSTFTTGRGGAGNVHSSSERAIFSFDEELEREMRRAAPVYHVGRGGAGNMMHRNKDNDNESILSRKFSSTSQNSAKSNISSTSDRARDMALRGLEKGWEKIRGMA